MFLRDSSSFRRNLLLTRMGVNKFLRIYTMSLAGFPLGTLHMGKLTFIVEANSFGDRRGTHLRVKELAFLPKITTLCRAGTMFQKFFTPFWVKKAAIVTFKTVLALISFKMNANFGLWLILNLFYWKKCLQIGGMLNINIVIRRRMRGHAICRNRQGNTFMICLGRLANNIIVIKTTRRAVEIIWNNLTPNTIDVFRRLRVY